MKPYEDRDTFEGREEVEAYAKKLRHPLERILNDGRQHWVMLERDDNVQMQRINRLDVDYTRIHKAIMMHFPGTGSPPVMVKELTVNGFDFYRRVTEEERAEYYGVSHIV